MKRLISLISTGWGREIWRIIARQPLSRPRECVICGHRLGRFLPYRTGSSGISPLARMLEVIGSDVDHFECPWCGAHDRERHLVLYMYATRLLPLSKEMRVLHFAPERQLAGILAGCNPALYVRGDLFPTSPDIERLDITAISYPDDCFDLVLANHVLEHVADDTRALSEVRRVLRPGGHAVLQTPYSRRLVSAWSDAGVDTDDARCLAFGQEDHIRLYGRDIFARFAAVGFESRVGYHADLLPEVDASRVGVNSREPFMLFRKPVR